MRPEGLASTGVAPTETTLRNLLSQNLLSGLHTGFSVHTNQTDTQTGFQRDEGPAAEGECRHDGETVEPSDLSSL